jgi:hypothetical protein
VESFEYERELLRNSATQVEHFSANETHYVEQSFLEVPDLGNVFGMLILACFVGFIVAAITLILSFGVLMAFGVYCVSSAGFFFILLLIATLRTSLIQNSRF